MLCAITIVDITVSHTTENRAGGGGYALFESHNHDYTGRKKITVHNGLHVGETVIMLRQAGGQGFVRPLAESQSYKSDRTMGVRMWRYCRIPIRGALGQAS